MHRRLRLLPDLINPKHQYTRLKRVGGLRSCLGKIDTYELRAAIILFFSMLDEKLRRLYAGLEALKTGRGGDAQIAELLGLDITTVARGRRELLDQDVEVRRVRRSGAGRRPMKKKHRK